MGETTFVIQLRRTVSFRSIGRGDRIRTCDILLPKQARYRAALLPDPSEPAGGGPGRIRTRDLAVMSGQL
jgi:hypothetical protein